MAEKIFRLVLLMKQHLIRISYFLISTIIILLAYNFYNDIVKEQRYLNSISYLGTVVTIIGFIVTISEVFHNLYISKSIQLKAKLIFKKIKLIETASGFSDCLAAIDDINNCVTREDYSLALKNFQYFRKMAVKIPPISGKTENFTSELNIFGGLERNLLTAVHSTPRAPLNKKQKSDLIKKILLIKQEIEDKNPARGDYNVTW